MRPITIIMFTALMSMVTNKVHAYDIAVDNEDGVTIYYDYDSIGKCLYVVSKFYEGSDYAGDIVIPETVIYQGETLKVTRIAPKAFYRSRVTSVVISNSVEIIGYNAFSESIYLTTLTMGNGVRWIESNAFSNCNNLKKVIIKDISAWCQMFTNPIYGNPIHIARHIYSDENTEITNLVIPDNVNYISSDAFKGCEGLKSVTIPNKMTSIGESSFAFCTGLTTLTLLNGDKEMIIGDNAFEYCSSLVSVNMQNGVKEIGALAFCACSSLESIIMPNSLEEIKNGAFQGCTNLTSVAIPNSLFRIGDNTFSGCSALSSVTIPLNHNLRIIGGYAFTGCNSLASFTIPYGVNGICAAFWNCNGLTSVTIPKSIERMDHAFYGCSNLKTVTIQDGVKTINEEAFSGCSNLTSITIPNSVVKIEDKAFYGCNSLISVTIGSGVKYIGINSFSHCENLLSITSLIENPNPIEHTDRHNNNLYYPFDSHTFSCAKLYVPLGTLNKYKSSNGWKNFRYIEEMCANIIEPVKSNKTEMVRYNIKGQIITESQKGVIIIKMSDGTTRKVITK